MFERLLLFFVIFVEPKWNLVSRPLQQQQHCGVDSTAASVSLYSKPLSKVGQMERQQEERNISSSYMNASD